MSKLSVVIDCFPESVQLYLEGYAVVVVDVIRTTTTAITAVETGRRCFFSPSIERAKQMATYLDNPLLAGEVGGDRPEGFDMNNSPAEIARRTDIKRPILILSSSGTKLLYNARNCTAAYVACLRNYGAIIDHLVGRHEHVAVIGAGSRGEFREEDQMCCALVANGLMKAGYEPENKRTAELVDRWKDRPVETCFQGRSVEYLKKSGQLIDLEFILKHVNDLDLTFAVDHDEITIIPKPQHRTKWSLRTKR